MTKFLLTLLIGLAACGQECAPPTAETARAPAIEIAPLEAAFGTLLSVGTEDSLRQARALLDQIEAHVPAGEAEALRGRYEDSLIRLGERRARRTPEAPVAVISDSVTPVAADEAGTEAPSPDVMQRIETRRQREELIQRALKEMALERMRRLREDVEYRRERSQGTTSAPLETREMRDERVLAHLQGQFEQAIHERQEARCVALLEDLRLLDPSADLMHNYLALRAMQERGVQQGGAPSTGLPFPALDARRGPASTMQITTATGSPASAAGGRAAGMDAAGARTMLDGALGKLRTAGPEGQQMADALSAFVASGGQNQKPLQEALASFRQLQATSGGTGGAMGGMLEQMLGQLGGSRGGGSTADLSMMLGLLQGSGLGAPTGAQVSPGDLQSLQQALSSVSGDSAQHE